jgi:hypothetical protein
MVLVLEFGSEKTTNALVSVWSCCVVWGRTGERAVPRGAGVHERLRVEVGDSKWLDGLLAGAEGLGRGVWEEGRGVLEVESGEGIECRRGYAHGEAEELHEAHNARARVANKEKGRKREWSPPTKLVTW